MPNIFESYEIAKIAKGEILPAVIPKSDREEWLPYIDWKAGDKALVLSDAHIPYHSETALQSAVEYGKAKKCNVIINNGDMQDCAPISHWLRDPRLRTFDEEIKMAAQFFSYQRKMLPKARIKYKLGNHEERWERFVEEHPNLVGLECLDPKNLLKLGCLDIDLIRDGRPIIVGQLTILHGHELGKGGASSVNPARGLYLRAGSEFAMVGHYHRSSHHAEPTLSGRNVATWSTGCLCGLRPKYARVNKWNHGAAIVTVHDDEGHFSVENFYISQSGKIY